MDPQFKPILRHVDAIPGVINNQRVLFLRDPVGFVDEMISIPLEAAFLLSLMDGEHDLRDLQVEASRRFGQLVPYEEIEKFVQLLDDKGYLWSPKFEKLKEKAYQEWFSLPVRPMSFADQSYPSHPEQAKAFIEEILSKENGGDPTPNILIAPHIDLRIGAQTYASAYCRAKFPSGSRIIMLGVGHYLDYPFSILTKDIYTPFGLLRFDRGGFFYLANSKGIELFPNHIVHRREHSLEFQALFLNYLCGDEVVALPILVGSHRLLQENEDLLDKLVEGLVELMDEKTYFILGVDFCHLGLRYGDPFAVNEELCSIALKFDQTVIELSAKGESEALAEELKKNEELKCCGSGCLFLVSKFIERLGASAQPKIYRQEALPFGEGSAVTVAGAGFYF